MNCQAQILKSCLSCPTHVSSPLPVLATARPSPRSVALVRQAPLPRTFALARVSDGVVMVRVIGPATARLDGFLRRLGRDETVASVADQVRPAGLDECFPHGQ